MRSDYKRAVPWPRDWTTNARDRTTNVRPGGKEGEAKLRWVMAKKGEKMVIKA